MRSPSKSKFLSEKYDSFRQNEKFKGFIKEGHHYGRRINRKKLKCLTIQQQFDKPGIQFAVS